MDRQPVRALPGDGHVLHELQRRPAVHRRPCRAQRLHAYAQRRRDLARRSGVRGGERRERAEPGQRLGHSVQHVRGPAGSSSPRRRPPTTTARPASTATSVPTAPAASPSGRTATTSAKPVAGRGSSGFGPGINTRQPAEPGAVLRRRPAPRLPPPHRLRGDRSGRPRRATRPSTPTASGRPLGGSRTRARTSSDPVCSSPATSARARARRRAAAAALRRFQQADAANLLVSLGNNDPTRGRGFAAAWRSSFGWLPEARIDVAGALGPADRSARSGGYQSRRSACRAPYYVRRLRDVEVIVLDSTRVTAAQTAWLQQTLAAPSTRFRMVVLHHPPFSCAVGAGRCGASRRNGCRSSSATACGSWSPGTHPATSASARGGSAMSPEPSCRCRRSGSRRAPAGYPRRLAAKPGPAFVYVTAGAGRAQVRAVGLDGRTIDRFRVG